MDALAERRRNEAHTILHTLSPTSPDSHYVLLVLKDHALLGTPEEAEARRILNDTSSTVAAAAMEHAMTTILQRRDRRRAFAMLTKDSNKMTLASLQLAVNNTLPTPFTMDELKEMMAIVDTNGDGVFDIQDVMHILEEES